MGSEQELEWPVSRVRQTFIDYFVKNRGHLFVPSSPVLPHDDPTLLFANAGMNQFKPIFLGTVDPNSESAKWKRVANSQKCIRAGGKHNDLDDVGKDTYHHTFFEMLGNWSFGDYFKKEAIEWAWELLTTVYKLPTDRLYATYFGGDEKNGLPADEEARQIWLQYLPESRVLPFGAKDNFWEMGETGPCGPCSEIHFDRIGGRDASALVNRDDPTVIEIWNNVFIQFNREDGGSLRSLPSKHVDTGMGLERVASILQNKLSNYDTDVFTPIFQKIHEITNAPVYQGIELSDPNDTAYRVIADHIRTLSIAITDGILPNNDGRGYVLRRIVRRAVRYGAQFLNAKPGFFAQLAPTVVQSLGDFFVELKREGSLERIVKVLNEEETSFRRTLQRGIKMFNKYADVAKSTGSNVLSGADAFKLYDTYGFPIDLTTIMCQEKGMTINMDEYRQEIRDAQERSAQGAKETTKRLALQADHTNQLCNVLSVAPTDDSFKYEWKDIDARIVAIIRPGDNGAPPLFTDSIDTATGKDNVGLVFDRTNFYAESGGQTHDTGRVILSSAGSEFKVGSVQTFAGYVLHIGHVFKGQYQVGDQCSLRPDFDMRKQIAANHTTTHSLNFALRTVLGHKQTIDQRGSLVAHDRLRFDFTHNSPVSAEELGRVEEIVRQQIRDDIKVFNKVVPLEEGRQINTLRAVFGEDYPNQVRVVSVGVPVEDLLQDPTNPKWMEFAVEFCGGTHLRHMKQAGDFALLTEEGIAKGIRRIVAVSKDIAIEAHTNAASYEQQVAELEQNMKQPAFSIGTVESRLVLLGEELKSHSMIPIFHKSLLLKRISSMKDQIAKAKKEQLEQLKKEARVVGTQLGAQAKQRGDRALVISKGLEQFLGEDKALSEALDAIRKEHPTAAAIVIAPDEKKNRVFIKADVPSEFVKEKGFTATDWVSQTCAVCKGKGGGKPTSAFGQGTDITLLEEAVSVAHQFASIKLE